VRKNCHGTMAGSRHRGRTTRKPNRAGPGCDLVRGHPGPATKGGAFGPLYEPYHEMVFPVTCCFLASATRQLAEDMTARTGH